MGLNQFNGQGVLNCEGSKLVLGDVEYQAHGHEMEVCSVRLDEYVLGTEVRLSTPLVIRCGADDLEQLWQDLGRALGNHKDGTDEIAKAATHGS